MKNAPSSVSIFEQTNQLFEQAANFSNLTLTGEKHRAVTLSLDTKQSDFPALLQEVADIAEMRTLVGNDLEDDSEVVYPTPYDAEVYNEVMKTVPAQTPFAAVPDKKTADNLAVAYSAYLNGHATKVADYEKVLNWLHFPRQLAYFASADDCVLDDILNVTGNGTVVLNCAHLIFEKGGQIIADTEFVLTCDQITKQG